MITLTRPLFLFDLETTGTNVQEDRIVEIGFLRFEGIFPSEPTREWSHLVNPDISISKEAIKIHHITNEDVVSKPYFQELAPYLVKGFHDCDYAGKNIRFDLQILSYEMTRAHTAWSYADARIIDADRLEQLGDPRTLSHLYKKHLGKPLEGAHSALTDVKATGEVLAKQLQTYQHLPRDIDQLHRLQWPGWIDTEGKFRFMNGAPICTFGKYRGQSMQRVMPDYWNFILRSDFSDEIKNLATKALKGQFPTENT